METGLRPFRNRVHRRLAPILRVFGKLVTILAPQATQVPVQRMCPFCGLITPRYKTSCLECGRSLKTA
jgi:hypothetical protein